MMQYGFLSQHKVRYHPATELFQECFTWEWSGEVSTESVTGLAHTVVSFCFSVFPRRGLKPQACDMTSYNTSFIISVDDKRQNCFRQSASPILYTHLLQRYKTEHFHPRSHQEWIFLWNWQQKHNKAPSGVKKKIKIYDRTPNFLSKTAQWFS